MIESLLNELQGSVECILLAGETSTSTEIEDGLTERINGDRRRRNVSTADCYNEDEGRPSR